MNGRIRKYFHGSKQILDQLAFSVLAEQMIFLKTQNLIEEERKMFHGFEPFGNEPARFEGKCRKMSLSNNIYKLIELHNNNNKEPNLHNIVSHYRFGASIFTSELFGEGKCRHSSSCIFRHSDGQVACGRIVLFERNHKIAVIKPVTNGFLDDVCLPNDNSFRQICLQLSSIKMNHYIFKFHLHILNLLFYLQVIFYCLVFNYKE